MYVNDGGLEFPSTESPMQQKPRPIVNVDQEAWIIMRLEELIALHKAILLNRITWPGASDSMVNQAIKGAINGVAIELIYTFGMEPCFVNIKKDKVNSIDLPI